MRLLSATPTLLPDMSCRKSLPAEGKRPSKLSCHPKPENTSPTPVSKLAASSAHLLPRFSKTQNGPLLQRSRITPCCFYSVQEALYQAENCILNSKVAKSGSEERGAVQWSHKPLVSLLPSMMSCALGAQKHLVSFTKSACAAGSWSAGSFRPKSQCQKTWFTVQLYCIVLRNCQRSYLTVSHMVRLFK